LGNSHIQVFGDIVYPEFAEPGFDGFVDFEEEGFNAGLGGLLNFIWGLEFEA
jgi:hypothetical protein